MNRTLVTVAGALVALVLVAVFAVSGPGIVGGGGIPLPVSTGQTPGGSTLQKAVEAGDVSPEHATAVKAGTATVTLTGIGAYEGTVKVTVK